LIFFFLRVYESKLALVSGQNGFYLIEFILNQGHKILLP
jgi:hypothetical protein